MRDGDMADISLSELAAASGLNSRLAGGQHCTKAGPMKAPPARLPDPRAVDAHSSRMVRILRHEAAPAYVGRGQHVFQNALYPYAVVAPDPGIPEEARRSGWPMPICAPCSMPMNG
jgi:hypothetical protein